MLLFALTLALFIGTFALAIGEKKVGFSSLGIATLITLGLVITESMGDGYKG